MVEPVKPTVEPAKPTVEPAKPAAERLRLPVEPLKPTVEPAKPAAERLRLPVEPAKPTVDSAKPGGESSKPPVESAKPTIELKPAVERSKPVAVTRSDTHPSRAPDHAPEHPPDRTPTEHAGGGPGLITIDSKPYAVIFVDGKRYGETPLVNVSLPSGKHVVRAVSPSGASRTQSIAIEPGKTAQACRFEW
jgi:hypothetical protein